MSDVRYDQEQLAKDAQEFMDKFKEKMRNVVNETLGEAYINLLPYVETDSWTNYREALRLELQREWKESYFKNPWAVELRRTIFKENREEMTALLNQDLLNQIKTLEDQIKQYDRQRYTL